MMLLQLRFPGRMLRWAADVSQRCFTDDDDDDGGAEGGGVCGDADEMREAAKM